jgi:hypothetical protein
MNGWKTLTGGGLLIAWGVAGMVLGAHGPDKAIQYAAEGLGIIGLGHKLDKQTEALKPPASSGGS